MSIKKYIVVNCSYFKLAIPRLSRRGNSLKKISTDILDVVLKPVNSSVLSTIKTITPEEKELSANIDVQGYIDYDSRNKHDIASRFSGRIEKLYVKYNYQPIVKGSWIFDIYSPDLITAQENLIYILNSDSKETGLINAAKQKLKLLGFTDMQTDDLVHTKQVLYTIPVLSKWDGHIHEMYAEASSQQSGKGMSSMGSQDASLGSSLSQNNAVSNNSNKLQSTSELSIKEGMYVARGQTVFNVVDPHQVVLVLQIRVEDISKVILNQKVKFVLDGNTEIEMTGKINFIEPFLKPNSKTLMVRVDVNNENHKLKVGSLVSATIDMEAIDGLWIPAKSVINLGKEKMVWLKKDGYFVAHKIEIGAITKDWIEIYDGITKKDEIASEAYYLVDSEGFVKIYENENE
ncbi:hypothetical protein BH10BAC1_BH10BAC1_20250 [soil metagenome]